MWNSAKFDFLFLKSSRIPSRRSGLSVLPTSNACVSFKWRILVLFWRKRIENLDEQMTSKRQSFRIRLVESHEISWWKEKGFGQASMFQAEAEDWFRLVLGCSGFTAAQCDKTWTHYTPAASFRREKNGLLVFEILLRHDPNNLLMSLSNFAPIKSKSENLVKWKIWRNVSIYKLTISEVTLLRYVSYIIKLIRIC